MIWWLTPTWPVNLTGPDVPDQRWAWAGPALDTCLDMHKGDRPSRKLVMKKRFKVCVHAESINNGGATNDWDRKTALEAIKRSTHTTAITWDQRTTLLITLDDCFKTD